MKNPMLLPARQMDAGLETQAVFRVDMRDIRG
jgi:hypothetical protein